MQIRISGRHLELTPALRAHIEEKIERFNKYALEIIDAHVTVGEEKFLYQIEVSLFGKRLRLTEKSAKEDLYSAIDDVCSRMEKALQRVKDKIKGHRKTSPKQLFAGDTAEVG
ncbi:MAG: ribosome-associated translation inhibitor RaiA [Candidatus Omnitrophica bacterium]|nr:ribosome-associated translation inhibitor RaiA [Candidatus Omnitrophota bacterium]